MHTWFATFALTAPVLLGSVGAGGHYKLTSAPEEACRAGSTCSVAISLQALAEYHINDNYPYKFKAYDTAGVEFEGKKDRAVFSKADGDFARKDEKSGVMLVRFKPLAKGKVTLRGEYRLSVCSAENCELDKAEVSVDVDAK